MAAWIIGLAGLFGGLAAYWLERRIAWERRGLAMPVSPTWLIRLRPVLVTLAIMGLSAATLTAEWQFQSLNTPEVQPSEHGRVARTVYHVVLVALLVLGTVIDLDCYLLPDAITMTGLAMGVLGAVIFQELQIAHLWVDWVYAVPQLRGPYIPVWYDQYRWLHALLWSVTGATCGAGVTQGVRWLSRRILGQEAMGLGDVTFMAMIGSFLGWQAVLIIFTVAPLTGLCFAIAGRLLANRPYLPYGPCLAAATVIVLFGWSWFWAETRSLFSDLTGLGIILAAALGTLCLLLLGLRAYRQIPTGIST
ncbi:prepilin peptidase [bacterium]|nr:prepilin peptidase [bacterium]